jgi:prefoldin subunit 5
MEIPKRIIDEIHALNNRIIFLSNNCELLEKKLQSANNELENLYNRIYPESNKISLPMEKL